MLFGLLTLSAHTVKLYNTKIMRLAFIKASTDIFYQKQMISREYKK